MTNQYDAAIGSLSKYSDEIKVFLDKNLGLFYPLLQLQRSDRAHLETLIKGFITGDLTSPIAGDLTSPIAGDLTSPIAGDLTSPTEVNIKKPIQDQQSQSGSIFHLKIEKKLIPPKMYPYKITINGKDYKIKLAHVKKGEDDITYLHAIDIEPCIKIDDIKNPANIEFRTYAFRNKILTMEAKSLNGYIFPYVAIDTYSEKINKNMLLDLFLEEFYNMTGLHLNTDKRYPYDLRSREINSIKDHLKSLFDFYIRAYFYQIPNLIEKRYESDYIKNIALFFYENDILDYELSTQVETMAVYEKMKDLVKAMRRAMFLTYEFAVKKIRFLDLKNKVQQQRLAV